MTDWFDDAFAGAPLMAILRGMGVERSVAVATTAWNLGIDSVEVPLQTDEDEAALRDAGLAHVLAIAGLHMALVGGGLFWAARALLAAFPSLALRYPINKL
jgi:2-keto-3-deoxy-6-phosphogluconate aldolase